MRLVILFLFMTMSFSLLADVPLMVKGNSTTDQSPKEITFQKAEIATVVVFLSAMCPCSDSHIPYLKKLKEEFPKVTFVAIHSNVNEDAKTTEAYFKKVNLPFDVIQDNEAKIADAFKANKTPHSYIISKENKILYEGGVTSSAKAHQASEFFLQQALLDLTQGREIKQKETRTLGCVISREKDE